MTEIRPITFKSHPQPVLILLDQRVLPFDIKYAHCYDHKQVAQAIKDMVVRGAPAISIAAAYGLVLAASQGRQPAYLDDAYATLLAARPTARNLAWALDRVRACPVKEWVAEAGRIYAEDLRINHAIGDNLAAYITSLNLAVGLDHHPWSVYHHCNTGSLATAGYGTALGAVRSLKRDGNLAHCWVGETRPYLQGARLTAWELVQEGTQHTLVIDSAAGHLMSTGEVDIVLVGCDRVALDGGVANKIGTYSLAVLAKYNSIPFYVCFPWSTYDPDSRVCWNISIEERDGAEVRGWGDARWALEGSPTYNPAFDITPANLITGWVTETGVYHTSEELYAAWVALQALK